MLNCSVCDSEFVEIVETQQLQRELTPLSFSFLFPDLARHVANNASGRANSGINSTNRNNANK